MFTNRLTRRWIKARPGSVLILVIALLVLLALIGTAYLSSTQTERYSSVQNSINTEADLLIQGLQVSVNSAIAGGLYSGSTYRPPTQEMPTYPGGTYTAAPVQLSGYQGYDSSIQDPALNAQMVMNPANVIQPPDLFLADRIPTIPPSIGIPTWAAISWPLFTDSSGGYTFDSPFDNVSLSTFLAINKGKIETFPTYRQINGQYYPAFYFYVPSPNPNSPTVIQTPGGGTLAPVVSPGQYLTNDLANPLTSNTPTPFVAASASGDGIADSGLFKLPVGQINGVTYYASTRVIDNNSAVNVSTAWTSAADPQASAVTDPIAAGTVAAKTVNYGFFRSNVGLREMLNTASVQTEMNELNYYRFNNILASNPSAAAPTINGSPVDDTGATRSDFTWYSAGDALEQQLARRPGNPGYNTYAPNLVSYHWLGQSQSAALAYKFSLINPNVGQSTIETILPSELYNYTGARTTPYSPLQVYSTTSTTGFWFNDLFDFSNALKTMPLRSVLTASNPVSNAIASRLGNASSTTPVNWVATSSYEFGDWVTYNGYSYVCLIHQPANSGVAPNTVSGAVENWALVPWTGQPVKTSINTATFNQLWLGFCQVMTDSIAPSGGAGSVPQWNPPALPQNVSKTTYLETQMPMFRSSIRDNRSYPISNSTPTINTGNPTTAGGTRVQLTPMQMMQLRAALAAINTQGMRNANGDLKQRQVRSHHITLADTTGAPVYDVEVFSTDIQPYIGQVYVYDKDAGGASTANFIAIQLLNPYPVVMPVTALWGLATIDRSLTSSTPLLALTSVMTSGSVLPFLIPKATDSNPGVYTIYDGTAPASFTLPPGAIQQKGLLTAIGKELVILKPRLFSGAASSASGVADNYVESSSPTGPPNLYDLAPVDQIDLTGADHVTFPQYLVYKRAGNPNVLTKGPYGATYAWNFTWPGFYLPYNQYNNATGGPKTPPAQATPTNQPQGTYPFSQPILSLTTEPTAGSIDFTTVPGGPADITGMVVASPTYNTITMQLNNVGFPGTNPILASANTYPFGGFARNADILQVPYIGAYRITGYGKSPSTFYEMNSVTMDSALANDSTLQPATGNAAIPVKILPTPSGYTGVAADSLQDPMVEEIGKFCPIGDPQGSAANTQLDFGTDSNYWHYHWTKKIFDYFTVQAPHDDYFPNVDPAGPNNAVQVNGVVVTDTSATPAIPAKYPGATGLNTSSTVLPINNSNTQAALPNSAAYVANSIAAKSSEDTTGVEGLININTAPWKVLAQLPFVPPTTDNITFSDLTGTLSPQVATAAAIIGPAPVSNGVYDNIDIAKAIVYYRNQNGPFKSIADLYKVPAIRLEAQFLMAADPSSAQGLGDFSGGPGSALGAQTPDNIRFDYEEKFLILNNISNLITTRSDTFTCYVLLQGWRNVGTGNPTLVVQRRMAFLADRNGVTPSSNAVSNFPVPGD